jgi:GR25 family glycosyltransferase involved in LPS biosynthesis
MHKIIIIFLLVFSFILIKMRRKQIENLSLLTYKDAKYYSLTNKWKCDLLVSEPNNNFINDFFQDNVQVINLKTRPDKLKTIKTTLDKLNINFNVFEAIKGVKICEYLKMGETGCAQSHRAIWQSSLEKDAEWTLILEDDIVIPKGITQETFGWVLRECTFGFRDPFIIYFGHCGVNERKIDNYFFNKKDIYVSNCVATCMHAYAINKKVLKKLLDYSNDFCRAPIDIIMRQFSESYIDNIFCVSMKKYKLSKQEFGDGIVLQKRNTTSDCSP